MTTESNTSPAPEPQGAVQAQPQNGAPQNQQGQHSQGQGHRRRRRRRNKAKNPQSGPAQAGQQPQAPVSHHQGPPKQKSGKRFFQKSPGNQAGNYNGNGFRPMPGNGNGNGNGGGRRKNKGRRQQVFVGPMDHSYRTVNGNVADPVTHSANNDFRGMPHSGFYSETDFYPPVPMREDAPTRIYCFIEDLFFLAKIQEVSKKLGIKVAFVKPDKEEKDKDVLAKLIETGEEDRPALILFDLNNANVKPLTLIPKIRAKLKRSTSIIGFLSHVQGDLKSKALEAGCDTVMPRATFSQNLPSLLRRYGAVDEEAADEYQAIQA